MLFIEPHAGVAPVTHFVRDARTRLDINTYQKAPQCSAGKRVAVQGGGDRPFGRQGRPFGRQ